MKKCSKCGLLKPLDDYYRDSSDMFRLSSACKACKRGQGTAYYRANRERCLAAMARYQSAHLDKLRSYQADYKSANAQRLSDQNKTYRQIHRDRIAEQTRLYNAANPDKVKRAAHLRRARKVGAAILGKIDFRAIRNRDRDMCWLCGHQVAKAEIHMDHAVALANLGEHSTRNIRVAHKLCNLKKGTKDVTHQRLLL